MAADKERKCRQHSSAVCGLGIAGRYSEAARMGLKHDREEAGITRFAGRDWELAQHTKVREVASTHL